MAFAPDRIARVNEILKREIAAILDKESITIPNMLISVTKVQCSSSLKNATVYVSIYGGGPEGEERALELLESKRTLIQRLIAKTIVLKYTPVLRFTTDKNIEEGARVLDLLRDIEEEEKK